MVDFEIRKRDRVCSSTGEELQPGELFYSALVEQENEIVRLDFSKQAWQQPPDHCIGWWSSYLPIKNSNRVYWAPNAVIMNYFVELNDNQQKTEKQSEILYLLSLLMVRKRILRMDEVEKKNDIETGETSEVLVLHDTKEDIEYRVAVVPPSPKKIEEAHQELCELLFSDEPPDLDHTSIDEVEIDETEVNESELESSD